MTVRFGCVNLRGRVCAWPVAASRRTVLASREWAGQRILKRMKIADPIIQRTISHGRHPICVD